MGLHEEVLKMKTMLEGLGQHPMVDNTCPWLSKWKGITEKTALRCGDIFLVLYSYNGEDVTSQIVVAGAPISRFLVRPKTSLAWLRRHFSGKAAKEFTQLEETLAKGAVLLWSGSNYKIYQIKDTDVTVVLQPAVVPPVKIRKLTGELLASTTPGGFDGALKKGLLHWTQYEVKR